MIIDELIAKLGFEVEGEGDLKKFNDGLEKVEKKARVAADRINAMSVAIGSFVGTIAANVVSRAASAIGSLPGDMTRAAADFESLMTGIQKKAGATAEQMEVIGREVLDLGMGGELASSIEEIAAAYERGAAAGLPLDELREFALLSTKAADAFEMSAEATGNAFVGFQKVLGVAGEDLERVADLINYLADSGIADERDIVQFMDSAGALAKTVGFSVEETAALAAALVNLKIPAGEAATAMNSVLTKLIAPQAMSKGARAAFQAVAGDVNAFAKSMSEDADQALVGLLEKLAQLDSSARAGAIAEIFGLNHADVVQQLVSGVDELKRNLAESKNEAAWLGSLQETYRMKLDDFWSKSQRFWNNTTGLLTILGEKTLPIFGDALDTMSDFIHRIAFDGSLDAIADGFERTLRTVRSFGGNVWSVGKFIFNAADGVTELVSRITGLNKAASAGILGAAVIGSTPTGRALIKWLAARFPAVAALVVAEDLIAGLSGKASFIGKMKGGQEALDKLREGWGKLTSAAEELLRSLDGVFAYTPPTDSFLANPQQFLGEELVKMVKGISQAFRELAIIIRAVAMGDWNTAAGMLLEGASEEDLGKIEQQQDRLARSKRARDQQQSDDKGPAKAEAAPLEGAFRWFDDKFFNGALSSDKTDDEGMFGRFKEGLRSAVEGAVDGKGDRLGPRTEAPSSDRFGGESAQPANAEALFQALENFKINMQRMAPDAAAQAVANDNSVANDNRDQSSHVTVGDVNVNVTEAVQAPAAVGHAIRNEVSRTGVAPAARIERSAAQ